SPRSAGLPSSCLLRVPNGTTPQAGVDRKSRQCPSFPRIVPHRAERPSPTSASAPVASTCPDSQSGGSVVHFYRVAVDGTRLGDRWEDASQTQRFPRFRARLCPCSQTLFALRIGRQPQCRL